VNPTKDQALKKYGAAEYSLATDTEKDNFMLQYLRKGKLAYIFGKTLFLHGAIDPKTMGRVPGAVRYIDKVHQWVRALNDWAASQVEEFEQDPYSGKNTKTRKGFGLMDYGVPGGHESRTVVYNNFLDNGNGKHVDVKVQKYLLDGQISQVLSGHQPHGDCPLVIRTGSLNVITADTSYSHFGHGDNRGQAVSEVMITEGRYRSSHVHGKLADGTAIKYTVTDLGEVCPGKEQGDRFVGKQLSDGRWVKAKTHNPAQKTGLEIESEEYLLCYGEGTKLTHSRMSAQALGWMEFDKTSGFKFPADDEIATPPEVHTGDVRSQKPNDQTREYFQKAYLLKDHEQPSSSSPTPSDRRSESSSSKNVQKSGQEMFGMKWVDIGTNVPHSSLEQISCSALARKLPSKTANQDVVVDLAHDPFIVGILKNFSQPPLRQNHYIQGNNKRYDDMITCGFVFRVLGVVS
jgi:hypothetical protein